MAFSDTILGIRPSRINQLVTLKHWRWSVEVNGNGELNPEPIVASHPE